MALQLDLSAAPAWARLWARSLEAALTDLAIVRHGIVAAVADLPSAERWPGRSIIVRDVGAGVKALCFALDGDWYRSDTGATL